MEVLVGNRASPAPRCFACHRRRRRAITLVVIGTLVSCSIPEKHLTDGGGDPLGCFNQPLPTNANPKVTISGVVNDPFSGNTLDMAQVQAFLIGVATPIFTTPTSVGGVFTHDQGTGGFPRDAYLKVSENGFLDSYFYPAAPITKDYSAQIQALSMSDFASIGAVAGITLNPTLAQILVVVRDCNGAPLAGATSPVSRQVRSAIS